MCTPNGVPLPPPNPFHPHSTGPVGATWVRTFGPMGPWITTRDEINDPNNLRIHAYKNGECFTDDTTKSYTFSIEELISDASRFFTLEAGDIISCGTAAKGNQAFPNAHRNVLLNEEECLIDISIDGLGTLSHPVKHTK